MGEKIKFFSKVGKTRIVPIRLKILLIFISIILLSTFSTNIISIKLSQREIINLNNTIMLEQLKEIYTNSANQYQIYSYSGKIDDSMESLKKIAAGGFNYKNSVALGVTPEGQVFFSACNNPETDWNIDFDNVALSSLNEKKYDGVEEGSVSFDSPVGEYFGVYKFQDDLNCYIIRAELRSDLDRYNYRIFLFLSILALSFTILFLVIGYYLLNREFNGMKSFTNDLIEMQKNKRLDLIDISKATNDDVTYMAASFNNLSSQVNNLLGTFQKFVSKDIVQKAYAGKNVGLEGKQRELTMLFSDVKSFTYRTETLGNDIIEVLNVHYNRVIQDVHEYNGIVGSIIGDAILAVYGTLDSVTSKSYNAILSAWEITRSTAKLREEMENRRIIIEERRKLTESEERVFKAVLVDVGVGIDGGNVFYGTIGRNDVEDPKQAHMANTVIGDNVNSASRLEGLTRIYKVPVIVSEYIKDEVSKETDRYRFFEIDTVYVKGKAVGKKIYFPFDTETMDNEIIPSYEKFEEALQAYYDGDWKSARRLFKETKLDAASAFLERMGMKSAPADWSGIWTMTTK